MCFPRLCGDPESRLCSWAVRQGERFNTREKFTFNSHNLNTRWPLYGSPPFPFAHTKEAHTSIRKSHRPLRYTGAGRVVSDVHLCSAAGSLRIAAFAAPLPKKCPHAFSLLALRTTERTRRTAGLFLLFLPVVFFLDTKKEGGPSLGGCQGTFLSLSLSPSYLSAALLFVALTLCSFAVRSR